MKHFNHTNHEHMTTGRFAIAMVPVILLATGLTSLMAAKTYRTIRLANAEGEVMEATRKLHD